MLVGNKCDVDDELKTRSIRQVSPEDAQAFKEKHRIHYSTEVSAKTGKGIKELVEHIARSLYHLNKDNLASFKEGLNKKSPMNNPGAQSFRSKAPESQWSSAPKQQLKSTAGGKKSTGSSKCC